MIRPNGGIEMDKKEIVAMAMEIFPKLTMEERIIVHELIESLRQNPTPAADPQGTKAKI